MACHFPIPAYRLPSGDVIFHDKGDASPFEVPCGRCTGCRLERSRQWAMRCVHEASLHDDNCFITLTYSPENLPSTGSLVKADFQKFMKRLRKRYTGKTIRYFMCGEYGEKNNRPHYHAILFGLNFPDWRYVETSPSGHEVYTSAILEHIWGLGFVTIGTVTFESAAYVARYVMKKINGPAVDQVDPDTGLKPYERFDSRSGEIVSVEPEYCAGSRRPGIAAGWIEKFKSDCYPKGFTTIRGVPVGLPRYYDLQVEKSDPDLFQRVKDERRQAAYENSDENSESRLRQKRIVKEAQFSQLKRTI